MAPGIPYVSVSARNDDAYGTQTASHVQLHPRDGATPQWDHCRMLAEYGFRQDLVTRGAEQDPRQSMVWDGHDQVVR